MPLKFFKCGWFDEKDYFEFFPLKAVYPLRHNTGAVALDAAVSSSLHGGGIFDFPIGQDRSWIWITFKTRRRRPRKCLSAISQYPDNKNSGYRTIHEASNTGANKGVLSEGSASYASTVSGWQDRPMVDSPDADRRRLPLERDPARRGACPDGKVAVGPSRPYEARVHRAWAADPTSSTSHRWRGDSQ